MLCIVYITSDVYTIARNIDFGFDCCCMEFMHVIMYCFSLVMVDDIVNTIKDGNDDREEDETKDGR